MYYKLMVWISHRDMFIISGMVEGVYLILLSMRINLIHCRLYNFVSLISMSSAWKSTNIMRLVGHRYCRVTLSFDVYYCWVTLSCDTYAYNVLFESLCHVTYITVESLCHVTYITVESLCHVTYITVESLCHVTYITVESLYHVMYVHCHSVFSSNLSESWKWRPQLDNSRYIYA